MIINSIRDFIKTCPYLSDFSKLINVDYLGEDTTSYSIEEIPVEPIMKRYINNDTVRQYDFIFASREDYGSDVLQNIENSGFYEKFAYWLELENNKGNLPQLSEGKTATKIITTSNGYAFQTDVNKARYQIQCKLIYFQGGM